MFACGGVQDPLVFETAPRSELQCSLQVQLAESNVQNTVLVVELADDGIDPITWSTPPSIQVCYVDTSICVGNSIVTAIAHCMA